MSLFTKHAQKDVKKKAEDILPLLQSEPFCGYLSYEKLIGDLTGSFSGRINIQHRVIYQVMEEKQVVKIIRMWTRYKQ